MSSYAEIPGVNFSSLKYIAISPKMYRHRLANPEPRKKSWVIGGAIHCKVLEPEAFDRRYIVLDAETVKAIAPARNTKEGKALVAQFPGWAPSEMSSDEYVAACVAEMHPGKEALSPAQHATVVASAEAVHSHRVARDLLRGGVAEETLTWVDSATGLRCKGRLDYLRPDFLLDLKSSRDPAPAEFERAALRYGYAAQAAFYHRGALAAKRLSGSHLPVIVAVRTKDDFDVACFRLSEEAFAIGQSIVEKLLHRLAECTAADYWPGVAPEMRSLNLPPWAVAETIDVESEEF